MNIVHGHVMPHLAATKSFAARRRETEPKGSPAGSEFYARARVSRGFVGSLLLTCYCVGEL